MNVYEVVGREYFSATRQSQSNILRSVFLTSDWHTRQHIHCHQVVNCLDSDVTGSFLLSGEVDGNVKILSVCNRIEGDLKLLNQRKFRSGFVTGLNWFPKDNGMFCTAYNQSLILVDCNSFSICESYSFEGKQLFWSDWNPLDANLIAVAASDSAVRLIDVRVGGSSHSLTLSSPLASKNHSVTRVLWDGTDSEALFAGDSSGCIHLYDIRNSRKAVQVTTPEHHVFQTITCLQRTPDSMSIVSSHGMYNLFTLWNFRSKTLVNSNVHFHMPVRRKTKGASPPVSGLMRTQLFMRGDLMFSPVAEGTGEVFIHDLKSGALIRTLDSQTYVSRSSRKVNAVSGSLDDVPVLYSAGKTGIKVWCPRINEGKSSHPLHEDNWSDDE